MMKLSKNVIEFEKTQFLPLNLLFAKQADCILKSKIFDQKPTYSSTDAFGIDGNKIPQKNERT